MLELIPSHIDYYDDLLYTKVRQVDDNTDERIVTLQSGGFYVDKFNTDEEYDKLKIYAVLDQYGYFVTDEDECRKILADRDRRKWLYIFDCHI